MGPRTGRFDRVLEQLAAERGGPDEIVLDNASCLAVSIEFTANNGPERRSALVRDRAPCAQPQCAEAHPLEAAMTYPDTAVAGQEGGRKAACPSCRRIPHNVKPLLDHALASE